MDIAFGQSHDPGGDLVGALVAHEPKRPGQHMRAVRVQNDGAAFYVDWLHWSDRGYQIGSWKGARAAFCICRISVSDRRKASIDSAPWFSLLRSACSPSRQPPVCRAVEFLPEIVPTEEPVEGALRLFVPPRVGCGAVRFQASRDGGRAPRWAAGRSPRVRRCADRIRCCRWAAVAHAAKSVRPPASATPVCLVGTRSSARWRVR